MLDAAEKDELRSLQARAYGRHGGLTDADLERLHELESSRAVRSGASRPSAEERRRTDAGPLEVFVEADERPDPAERADSVDDSDDSEQEGTAPERASRGRALRRHWRGLVAGAAVIAVAGIGIGGMLFGDRGAPAVELTPEQQEWQNELLATAEYDPGSLRAVGEEEGVVAWYATKKDGELVCVILSDGRNTRPSCTTAAGIAVQGLNGQFRTPAGEAERLVDAHVQLDAEGDPAVTLSSQLLNGEVSVFPTYSPEEEETAATLAASGTFIMRSTAPGTKLGSMRGRPMPSIREPQSQVTSGSPVVQPSKKQEFSGSATQMRVSYCM